MNFIQDTLSGQTDECTRWGLTDNCVLTSTRGETGLVDVEVVVAVDGRGTSDHSAAGVRPDQLSVTVKRSVWMMVARCRTPPRRSFKCHPLGPRRGGAGEKVRRSNEPIEGRWRLGVGTEVDDGRDSHRAHPKAGTSVALSNLAGAAAGRPRVGCASSGHVEIRRGLRWV